ncbi:hypothetical protein FCV88_19535 [Escherichia coli]|jgi:transcription elongation factor Elf1|uniref:hypothetical protein n=1 Tax=Escherichia TaxID=561 RepID=UPI000D108CCC|nr:MULTISPECIES: hypothetical protein [Escherichia]HBN3105435.1 hypothetical protein [Escherichia coli O25b:H4-ST131]EEY6246386.1 hypothetical protein [Escherichia coli]EFF0762576.1 hypothetical protein [Escherichia coli]EFH5501169.1 hypothetical protein [Escherichia coli]EFN4328650.1 hypothetical protein [Escherichia coli]
MCISAEKYIEWVKRAQSNNVALTAFNCPKCKEQIMTQCSPEKEVWDTFTCCPWCSAVFFKQVKGTTVKVGVILD